MLTCNVFIARKTRVTMSTLQAVAQIPAFMAGSILTLRRRKDVAKANRVVLRISVLPLAQPQQAVAHAVSWGVVCRTPASNDVMAITKWSI
jgi:hypothetical protein